MPLVIVSTVAEHDGKAFVAIRNAEDLMVGDVFTQILVWAYKAGDRVMGSDGKTVRLDTTPCELKVEAIRLFGTTYVKKLDPGYTAILTLSGDTMSLKAKASSFSFGLQ